MDVPALEEQQRRLDRARSPSRVAPLDVRADARLCDHVAARGGVLWVRSERRRCCGGAVTSLRATLGAPRDASCYVTLETSLPITVRFLGSAGAPGELVLELRGVARKRPAAYWDGCAYKL